MPILTNKSTLLILCHHVTFLFLFYRSSIVQRPDYRQQDPRARTRLRGNTLHFFVPQLVDLKAWLSYQP